LQKRKPPAPKILNFPTKPSERRIRTHGTARYHDASFKTMKPANQKGTMDETAISALLDSILAPWVKELRLVPESVAENAVTLRLPYSDHLRHAGGVICGQVFMAAADTAMVVAVSHVMGGFVPMTTVSLNTTFMRPVKAGDVLITAHIQRRGRNLVFGEIDIHDDEGELAAHATTTYALINK
jgi:uncharacterized protein (TIGR00369 family)